MSNSAKQHNDNKQVSVLYGIDDREQLVHANVAIPQKTYYCPVCRTPMHITHRGDNRFFACYKDNKHTKPACRSRTVIHDILLTNKETFFKGLETCDEPTSSTGGGFGATRSPANGEVVRPCTRLEHLFKLGLFHYAVENDLFGQYRVGDIIITKQMIPSVMREQRALDHRVIYALPDWVDYQRHTIRFVLLHNTRRDDRRFMEKLYFTISFDKHYKEFQNFRNMLFDKDGKACSGPVLVAAKWRSIPHPECFKHCPKDYCCGKDWICMGFQMGTFYNNKQIYVPPQDYFGKPTEPQPQEVL